VATRNFQALNNGKQFLFKFHRLHDFLGSLNYIINNRLNISILWIYGSGYPVSLPIEKYAAQRGGEILYIPELNNYQMPAYHRLDAGIHYQLTNKKIKQNLSFDIYNVYNRKNAVNMYFGGYKYKSLNSAVLIPIIPSISYTLKF